MVPEQNEVVVHFDGLQENCVLQTVAEIFQDSLEVLSLTDLLLPLADVVELDRDHGEEGLKQFHFDIALAVAFFKRVHFDAEDVVGVVVAVHIAGGVVEHGFFDGLGDLHFFFGKHGYHVGDDLAAEISDQFQVGSLPLHHVLHFEVLVFGQVGVLASDLL